MNINKVLLLSDSFKESISSYEIKNIGEEIFQKCNIDIEAHCIADGGEGTVDIFIREMNYQKVYVKSYNAFLKEIDTYYAYNELTDTAVFDSAQIVGFLVNEKLDIMHASTYGIGLVLKEIIQKGIKNIYIGLGGSITNDGGSGMLQALGAKFYKDDFLVDFRKTPFEIANKVDFSLVFELFQGIKLFILSDVINPLIGPMGATAIFSKQKGASISEQKVLENWMIRYSKLFKTNVNTKGSGAAGGLGFALIECGGIIKEGIDVILEELNIQNSIDEHTLVITGEGKLDETSFQGKVVGKIISLLENHNHHLAIICGINEIENCEYKIYPMHLSKVSNYKETVKDDLNRVFHQIIKDYFINQDKVKAILVDKDNPIYKSIREEVFVIEQQIDYNEEFDEWEDSCQHYILAFNDINVGAFRLRRVSQEIMKLERVVILKDYRGLDLGKILIKKSLQLIAEQNYHQVLIHAQKVSQKFYEKCGFIALGDYFLEANIEHILMQKKLEK